LNGRKYSQNVRQDFEIQISKAYIRDKHVNVKESGGAGDGDGDGLVIFDVIRK
jgi:hypothetical protein